MSEEREYFRNRKYSNLWHCLVSTSHKRESFDAAGLLLEALSKGENLEIAERIYHYNDVFVDFRQDNKSKLQPNKHGLEDMLSVMREEIDSIILCRTDPVAIKYSRILTELLCTYAVYNLVSCSISVSKGTTEDKLPMIISHEYCHHVEYSSLNAGIFEALPVLGEGLADAAAMAATKSYAHCQKDRAALHFSEQIVKNRMMRTLFLIRANSFSFGFHAPKEHYRDDFYSIGCTAFLVAEAKHGQGIYKDIIRAENPLEMLVQMLGGGR